ncbi:hypothetical protein MKX01_007322 [Papaver californicum]|nr:hypothetical protein MKX01_007322 [Papaver californicum]
MQTSDVEDFSASATLILFKSAVPLMRIARRPKAPVSAGLSDDPSKDPFLLAFKDIPSWKSALQACEYKIIEQCEGGACVGCSISASNKCAPMDLAEREQCGEREMSACLVASKESCLKFAKDTYSINTLI